MKKIFALGIAFALFTVAASAQAGPDALHRDRVADHSRTGQLTRGEKFRMHNNDAKYHRTKHRFHRDGHMNRFEKRKMHNMKKHDRRQSFRHKHNAHRRAM